MRRQHAALVLLSWIRSYFLIFSFFKLLTTSPARFTLLLSPHQRKKKHLSQASVHSRLCIAISGLSQDIIYESWKHDVNVTNSQRYETKWRGERILKMIPFFLFSASLSVCFASFIPHVSGLSLSLSLFFVCSRWNGELTQSSDGPQIEQHKTVETRLIEWKSSLAKREIVSSLQLLKLNLIKRERERARGVGRDGTSRFR